MAAQAADAKPSDGATARLGGAPGVEAGEASVAAPGAGTAGPISSRGAGIGRRWSQLWPPVAVGVALVVAWHVYVVVAEVPAYLLPTPIDVLQKTFDFAGQQWTRHILYTTAEILIGFLAAAVSGVALGTLIAWSEWARRALVPLLVFLNTLPKVALAPMLLFWLGFGIGPNSVIAAVIAFFPVVVNTSVGLVQVDPDLIDLAKSLKAPTWRVFRMIRFPTAVPYILSSLKVAVTMTVVGAVVGEFVAGQAGLGYVITAVQSTLQTDVALAAMVWISVIGLVLYGLVDLVGAWLAPWARSR